MGTRWYDAARLPNVVLQYRVISIRPAAAGASIDSRVAGCLNTPTLSASIAVYVLRAIIPKRNCWAVDLTVSLAYADEKSNSVIGLDASEIIEWE